MRFRWRKYQGKSHLCLSLFMCHELISIVSYCCVLLFFLTYCCVDFCCCILLCTLTRNWLCSLNIIYIKTHEDPWRINTRSKGPPCPRQRGQKSHPYQWPGKDHWSGDHRNTWQLTEGRLPRFHRFIGNGLFVGNGFIGLSLLTGWFHGWLMV